MGNLLVTDEVTELRLGFTSKHLLAPTTAGLTNVHLVTTGQVGLHGISAAIHRLVLHQEVTLQGVKQCYQFSTAIHNDVRPFTRKLQVGLFVKTEKLAFQRRSNDTLVQPYPRATPSSTPCELK
jgi:hypothetical protein